MIEPLSKICDVVFNGRPAEPRSLPPNKLDTQTIGRLVARRTSLVRYDGRTYRITVKCVEEGKSA